MKLRKVSKVTPKCRGGADLGTSRCRELWELIAAVVPARGAAGAGQGQERQVVLLTPSPAWGGAHSMQSPNFLA